MNLGVYITDASFDKSSKVSVLSFINKTLNYSETIQLKDLSNIYEAELLCMKLAVKNAIGKYKDVIIFCDNKRAVFNIKKEIFNKIRSKFDSIQFIWLPRELLSEVDFLTKNIENSNLNINLKTENSIEQLSNTLLITSDNNSVLKTIQKIMRDVDLNLIKSEAIKKIPSMKTFSELKSISYDIEDISEDHSLLKNILSEKSANLIVNFILSI